VGTAKRTPSALAVVALPGMMVLAGAAWWIVFNFMPSRKEPPNDERPSA